MRYGIAESAYGQQALRITVSACSGAGQHGDAQSGDYHVANSFQRAAFDSVRQVADEPWFGHTGRAGLQHMVTKTVAPAKQQYIFIFELRGRNSFTRSQWM